MLSKLQPSSGGAVNTKEGTARKKSLFLTRGFFTAAPRGFSVVAFQDDKGH